MQHCIIEPYEFQEVLKDVSPTGSERPWSDKKMKNELLAIAYENINPLKSSRLRACGQALTFRVYDDGTKKLESMTSCRVRLCPLCSWRRALKTYSNVRQIVEYLHREKKQEFLFLTLTIKNVEALELSRTIDFLFESFNRFALLMPFKRAVNGWYRALEITHNIETDTFHPHFHCLLAVNKSYFTSRYYLSQKKWADLWKSSARLSYDPLVDIRRIKKDADTDEIHFAEACAEVAKYTVKDSDFIIPDDWDLTVDTVSALDYALANRRLIGYGGNFREVRRLLQLQDEDTGDLVNVGDNVDKNDENYKLQTFYWYSGYRQYVG